MPDTLQIIWFGLIAVLWFGFLLLDSFDLGVGMHAMVSKDETRRRVKLNAIGPVWDGNEVWLITAIGAMFAAFPFWYASLLSGAYILFLLVIIGLIARAIGLEYRSKGTTDRWRRLCTAVMGCGSFVAIFGLGGGLGLTTLGMPIDANGDVSGSLAWVGWPMVIGGLSLVGFSLLHGAVFLTLKTRDTVRKIMRRFVLSYMPLLLLPMLLWIVLLWNSSLVGWLIVIALLSVGLLAWFASWRNRDGWAFVFTSIILLLFVGGLFVGLFPNVIPSTYDPAFNLTIAAASSSSYTLMVMTVVAGFGVPLVIAAQIWSYLAFRTRLTDKPNPIKEMLSRDE